MLDHILATAKAYAALVGAILTAIVGTMTPDQPGYRLLTLAVAICSALTVYVMPNTPKPPSYDGSESPG